MSDKANHLQHLIRHKAASGSRGVQGAVGIAMLAAAIVFGFGALLSVSAGSRADTDEVSARELLQQARANREVFSTGFAGFTSRLTVRIDGGLSHGVFTFRMPDQLEIEMDEGELPEAVKRDIRSMLMHRVASDSDAAEEGVGYAAADANPLGRHIMMADSYRSAYRIRDRQILKVSRSFGDNSRIVLNVMETETTVTGRYLPKHVFAVRFDRETGELQEAWSYRSEFQRFGGEYLPLSRQVVSAGKGDTSAMLIEWDAPELLEQVPTD